MNNDKPYKLFNGDCLEELKKIKDNSIDAVVTDPPYEISFMNKGWDGSGIAFNTEVWEECLRVLKPGGHLLAFGATRTHHRMMVAIEDAGFEIRDTLMWMYGSGFPKSHNIGKAVDKIEGNEREDVRTYTKKSSDIRGGNLVKEDGEGWADIEITETKGQSDFEGYGTALKPAYEPIVMARKPVEGTIAENCLEHGTGGINIDDCRIGTDDIKSPQQGKNVFNGDYEIKHNGETKINKGRFPANVILDEEAGRQLDEQSGDCNSSPWKGSGITSCGTMYATEESKDFDTVRGYADKGGASRFFYCPKVSKAERNLGLKGFEEKEQKELASQEKTLKIPDENNGGKMRENPYLGATSGTRKNNHPTVKPKDLLEYLITLVKPPIDCPVILDPFMGSGTTGMAAIDKQCKFVGIEQDEEYMKIAEARVDYIAKKRRFW